MIKDSIFYEYIISGDDTTTKNYLENPYKKSTCVVNIGGRLTKEIPVHK